MGSSPPGKLWPSWHKIKEGTFANVLYLAHQLWELIPLGDHSEACPHVRRLILGACKPDSSITSLLSLVSDWPTACRELQLGQK